MHPIRLPKRPKGPWRAVVAVLLDVVITAGIALSVYYFNYRVPQRFALPVWQSRAPYMPEGPSNGRVFRQGPFLWRGSLPTVSPIR